MLFHCVNREQLPPLKPRAHPTAGRSGSGWQGCQWAGSAVVKIVEEGWIDQEAGNSIPRLPHAIHEPQIRGQHAADREHLRCFPTSMLPFGLYTLFLERFTQMSLRRRKWFVDYGMISTKNNSVSISKKPPGTIYAEGELIVFVYFGQKKMCTISSRHSLHYDFETYHKVGQYAKQYKKQS